MRAVIWLVLAGAAFAAPKSQQRIVGGEPTTIEQYPYMSNMQYQLWGFYWIQVCGGSLITTTAVLSAAYCYVGDSANLWRAVLGSSSASSGGTNHPASEIITHADYSDDTRDYDVAIIKLSVPAILGNTVRLANIAGPNFQLTDGGTITAIGWGATFSGGQAPDQLHHVDLNVINQELCVERYAYLKLTQPGFQNWPDITDRMLCAGILNEGGKDSCQGDRGGPVAFSNNIVVAISSWGYGCADSYYPGVNTRVSSLSNWIVTHAL